VNEFELIEAASELFTLKVEGFQANGLLYPLPIGVDGAIFAYGCPALHVTARVDRLAGNQNAFFACIRSIDDSGVSIFGPVEDSAMKAEKRFENFIALLENLQFQCPNKQELVAFTQKNGCHADYW
jgi:hypothetical protein